MAKISDVVYGTLIIQSEVCIYAKHFIIILIFGHYLSFIQPLQLECKINAGAEWMVIITLGTAFGIAAEYIST